MPEYRVATFGAPAPRAPGPIAPGPIPPPTPPPMMRMQRTYIDIWVYSFDAHAGL